MSKIKKSPCRICKKKHEAHGFCKYHNWALSKNKIDLNGKPSDGFYYDDKFHIKKLKCSLGRTVKESSWYRKWQIDIKVKSGYKCSVCGIKQVKFVIHHEKKRFSDILKDAKSSSNELSEQIDFCKKEHTEEIGLLLCRKCHAEKHKGEKMYASLAGKIANGKCKICGDGEYCMGFCSKHYKSYQTKLMDIDGNKLSKLMIHPTNGICIVCQKESRGRKGMAYIFCRYHYMQYYSKYIDEKGNVLKTPNRIIIHGRICKVCGQKHSAHGFCETHYNRFKIGQIDIDGNEIRKLSHCGSKGYKCPKKLIEYNGEVKSIEEWANIVGIDKGSMAKRFRKWDVSRAITTPKHNEQVRKMNERSNAKKK